MADKDQIDLFCPGLGHCVSLSVYWPAGLAYIGHDESSDHSSDLGLGLRPQNSRVGLGLGLLPLDVLDSALRVKSLLWPWLVL